MFTLKNHHLHLLLNLVDHHLLATESEVLLAFRRAPLLAATFLAILLIIYIYAWYEREYSRIGGTDESWSTGTKRSYVSSITEQSSSRENTIRIWLWQYRSPPLPIPASRVHSMSPSIHQPEPDTKIGGEAGMAGVGRRGFAAAARAALFTSNMGGEGPRGMLGGPFLDIAAAVRTTSTPPLTTNSSSPHSPGPVSPVTPFSTSPTSVYPLQASAMDKGMGADGSFFDKFRDRIPGLGIDSESSSPTDDIPTAKIGVGGGSVTPRAGPSRQNSNASEASTSSSVLSLGLAYSASNASSESKNPRRRTRRSSANSPGDEDGDTSGSEYGLAYADDTDYEDEKEHDTQSRLSVQSGLSRRTIRKSRDGATPTPGQRSDSLVKARQRPVSGSLYSDDDDDDNDLKNRLRLQSSPPSKTNLIRVNSNASVSSVSSTSSTSSAAAIAKALGLSRSSVERDPEGYSMGRLVMGGPGAPGVARTPSGSKSINETRRNRSATVSSMRSFRSDGLGRARSGTEGSVVGSKGDLEQAMKDLMNNMTTGSPPQPVRIGLRDDGPSPVIPPFFDSPPSTRGSKLAHRSNTVGITTPYTSAADAAKLLPKLPARSKTERGSKALHASAQQHYATPSIASSSDETGKRKVRICMKCDKRIDDGRWISIENPGGESPGGVGTGGKSERGEKGERKRRSVLCESCWKNMYLPKCRRCNLPIEKQAVSSSDGQLKGKYHKDCFNCFTCNKPFPDKVFYVYDGRPLCKYHYHEANESLCAAAICGQPIEGPCAVSHTGDKYHPEHLTCEWGGLPKCDVKLNEEYWELDGKMLCERHAKSGAGKSDGNGNWGDEKRFEREEGRASGARKRMTRFVDLGALGDLR
ncbi:lim domain containing protein [Lentinula edodes]|uniref:Lim domain containing protein n=1 Tax=Lentinula edodes TaxID=5353 RepID=A0A1Q3E2J1_LENED|nr:lim domain containing protein [Lentinula edodes]